MHLFLVPIFAMLIAFEPKEDVIEEVLAYEVAPEKVELGAVLERQLELILKDETRPLRAGFFKNTVGLGTKPGPNLSESLALRPGFTNAFEEKTERDASLVLVPENEIETPWDEGTQDEIEVGPQVHAKLALSVEKEIERDTAVVLQTAPTNDEEFEPVAPEVEDLFAFLDQPAITLSDSPPPSKDPYETLPITVEEKQKIGKILTTMAENNVFKLLFEKKYLERLGREVNHVHPVRFIGTVFSDPRLVHCMFQIRRSGFKWDGFIDGFRERFMEEVRAGNVDKYLPGLAKALNISAEDLQAYVRYKDVEGLVLYLMEKSRRHY